MRYERHVRTFQAVVAVASLVPILAGAAGVLQGPRMIRGLTSWNADLDSHFSYLSGLLFAMGVAFVYCALDVRSRAQSFRLLGLIVVFGGLARLIAITRLGLPSPSQQFAYFMELIVVPALLIWHGRLSR